MEVPGLCCRAKCRRRRGRRTADVACWAKVVVAGGEKERMLNDDSTRWLMTFPTRQSRSCSNSL